MQPCWAVRPGHFWLLAPMRPLLWLLQHTLTIIPQAPLAWDTRTELHQRVCILVLTMCPPYAQVAEVLSQLAALVAAVALPEPEQPAAEEAEEEAEKEGGEGAEAEGEAEEKPAPEPVPSAAEQKDAVGGCCHAAWLPPCCHAAQGCAASLALLPCLLLQVVPTHTLPAHSSLAPCTPCSPLPIGAHPPHTPPSRHHTPH